MAVQQDMSSSKKSFSFKLSSKPSNKIINKESSLCKDVHDKDDNKEEEKDFILSVGDKKIESSIPEKKKEKLVIPLIQKNKWRVKTNEENTDQLSNEAANEILEDLKNEQDTEDNAIIQPILMKNRLPNRDGKGKAEDGDIDHDIAVRPEQSTYEDYENIPITAFGTAILRGMGWSEGKGIGLTNQSVIEPINYIPRHKGLGLGAEKRPKSEENKKKRKLGEQPVDDSHYTPVIDENGRVMHRKGTGEVVNKRVEKGYFPGSYVQIQRGPHKQLYGKIASVGEDTARISIKLALSGEIVQISQYNTTLVDIDEYKKGARVDNPSKDNTKKNGDGERNERKQKISKKSENEESDNGYNEPTWIAPGIRVRIVSKSYKKGTYYNKKVQIVDVVSKNVCTCKTEDGKYLEDIHQKDLETVIPKTEGAYLLIVDGKYEGKFAKLLERNSKESKATIQLTCNKHITTTSYYNICEYVDVLPDDEFL